MNMNIYIPSIAIEHEISDFLQSSQGVKLHLNT